MILDCGHKEQRDFFPEKGWVNYCACDRERLGLQGWRWHIRGPRKVLLSAAVSMVMLFVVLVAPLRPVVSIALVFVIVGAYNYIMIVSWLERHKKTVPEGYSLKVAAQ